MKFLESFSFSGKGSQPFNDFVPPSKLKQFEWVIHTRLYFILVISEVCYELKYHE